MEKSVYDVYIIRHSACVEYYSVPGLGIGRNRRLPSLPGIDRFEIGGIKPIGSTEAFERRLDNILAGLREIEKFHPEQTKEGTEPLRDELFGMKSEHGHVIEITHNNEPTIAPFKIGKRYIEEDRL